MPASAAVCTGSNTIKQWWADQVPLLNFDLYCAVLPKGWGVVKIQVDYVKGGVVAEYANGSGQKVELYEGTFCHMYPNPCSSYIVPEIGDIPFGPLTAELSGSSGLWQVYVKTAPNAIYAMIGHATTQAQITAFSADVHLVS